MMRRFLKNIFLTFRSENRGATIIEYVLIVSLLSIVLMGGYRMVGKKYNTLYNGITDQLNLVDKTVEESGSLNNT